MNDVKIAVSSLKGNPEYCQCPRCKRYTKSGIHNFDGLCERCCDVLIHSWPDFEAVPLIKQHWLNTGRFVTGSPKWNEYKLGDGGWLSWLEQPPYKRQVEGSIPSPPTKS